MSAKAIKEATGKDLINRHLQTQALAKCRFAAVTESTNWRDLVDEHPWLKTQVSFQKFCNNLLRIARILFKNSLEKMTEIKKNQSKKNTSSDFFLLV